MTNGDQKVALFPIRLNTSVDVTCDSNHGYSYGNVNGAGDHDNTKIEMVVYLENE